MRLVLITREELEHIYVARRLHRDVGLAAIIVDRGRPRTRRQRIRQLWRKYSLVQLAGRAVLRALRVVWHDRAERPRQIASVLGADGCTAFPEDCPLTIVQGINSTEGVAAVERARPDSLLIYGTGIVGSRVLSLSASPPLNMHTGISPHYRGADCAFWPLYNDDLAMLGATVHECTQDVDGGRIFGTQHAALESDDREFSAFARCVAVGAELYVETCKRLQDGELRGEPQDLSEGVEYRSSMKGLRHVWHVRRQIRGGLIARYCDRIALAEPHE